MISSSNRSPMTFKLKLLTYVLCLASMVDCVSGIRSGGKKTPKPAKVPKHMKNLKNDLVHGHAFKTYEALSVSSKKDLEKCKEQNRASTFKIIRDYMVNTCKAGKTPEHVKKMEYRMSNDYRKSWLECFRKRDAIPWLTEEQSRILRTLVTNAFREHRYLYRRIAIDEECEKEIALKTYHKRVDKYKKLIEKYTEKQRFGYTSKENANLWLPEMKITDFQTLYDTLYRCPKALEDELAAIFCRVCTTYEISILPGCYHWIYERQIIIEIYEALQSLWPSLTKQMQRKIDSLQFDINNPHLHYMEWDD